MIGLIRILPPSRKVITPPQKAWPPLPKVPTQKAPSPKDNADNRWWKRMARKFNNWLAQPIDFPGKMY